MPRYIDAEKAEIELLNAMMGTGYQSRAINAIRYMPTADVAPVRHGKWEERVFYDDIVCVECGHSWNVIDNCTETFNFCPNCGAKMDLEEGRDG